MTRIPSGSSSTPFTPTHDDANTQDSEGKPGDKSSETSGENKYYNGNGKKPGTATGASGSNVADQPVRTGRNKYYNGLGGPVAQQDLAPADRLGSASSLATEDASTPTDSDALSPDSSSDALNTRKSSDDTQGQGGSDSSQATATGAEDETARGTSKLPEKLTKEDLIAQGLDPKVADYIINAFGNTLSGDEQATVSSERLEMLAEKGEITISPDGQIQVEISPTDGYTAFELLATTELDADQVDHLIYELGDDRTLSQANFKKFIDKEGNLTKAGERAVGDTEFNGNPVSEEQLNAKFDSTKKYDAKALEALGLTPEVAKQLTKRGPIPGTQVLDLVKKGELQAGLVDDKIQFRATGNVHDVPEDGLSELGLINSGMAPEEAAWLVDAYGSQGKVPAEEIDKHVTSQDYGAATLNAEAKKLMADRKVDASTLMADGADYQDLIGLGFSSSQTKFLLDKYGGEDGKSIPKETMDKLKKQGVIETDPTQKNPPRFQLNGESGMSAEKADEAAKKFAGDKAGTDKPALEIAADGTGNFFVAGEEAEGAESQLDTQQSVIFSRPKDKKGGFTGDYKPNNGNEQGHYDKKGLLALGFTQPQVDAMFKNAKDPKVMTMTEVRESVKANVGGVKDTADVFGNSVIMRTPGEAKPDEAELQKSPFAPTQQEAQWLNDTYGGGDGLTDAELKVALEEGVVQMIDGRPMMTAKGKALAHEKLGPSSGDIDSHQQNLLRQAFLEFDPNGSGADRALDMKGLTSMYNGTLSEADAKLILGAYGKDGKITQEQLSKAVAENKVIISERSGGEEAEGSKYALKITPAGYDDMIDNILADKDHKLTKQVHGVLNYPSGKDASTITTEQLIKNHGLTPEDAASLIGKFDKNGDGALGPRELLKAIMSEAVEIDGKNKITKVDVDFDSKAITGPYGRAALAAKIDSKAPPAADIADAILLDHGWDPKNKNAKVTDEQVEEWLRKNPHMAEDDNGKLTVIEPANKSSAEDVYKAVPKNDKDEIELPYGRRADSDDLSDWKGMSYGEVRQLSSFAKENKLGKSDNHDRLTLGKEDIKKLVDMGILRVDGSGNVALTEKGKLSLKANAGNSTMDFLDSAERQGKTRLDSKGNRYMDRRTTEDHKRFRFDDGEDGFENDMAERGHRPDTERGFSAAGLYDAASSGWVHFFDDDYDGGTVKYEVLKTDTNSDQYT